MILSKEDVDYLVYVKNMMRNLGAQSMAEKNQVRAVACMKVHKKLDVLVKKYATFRQEAAQRAAVVHKENARRDVSRAKHREQAALAKQKSQRMKEHWARKKAAAMAVPAKAPEQIDSASKEALDEILDMQLQASRAARAAADAEDQKASA